MWLIGSKENIQAYIAKVDKFNQYQGDDTAKWAEPRKHPDKNLYTVMKNPSVSPDTDLTQKETLPDDWSTDEKTTL